MIDDLKNLLAARRAALQGELMERRKTLLFIEADLLRARREADEAAGRLAATEEMLGTIEHAKANSAERPAARP